MPVQYKQDHINLWFSVLQSNELKTSQIVYDLNIYEYDCTSNKS